MGKIEYTEEYIRSHADSLDWRVASMNIEPLEVSESLIEDYEEEWDWDTFLNFKKMSRNFLEKFIKEERKIMLYRLMLNTNLTEDVFYYLLDTQSNSIFKNFLFPQLSNNSCIFNFSPAFILRNKDKIDWDNVSSIRNMPENFLRRYRKILNWNYILKHQTLSSEILEEFVEDINWKSITVNQTLSEKFVVKYINYLDMEDVIVYQLHLKDSFIQKLLQIKNET